MLQQVVIVNSLPPNSSIVLQPKQGHFGLYMWVSNAVRWKYSSHPQIKESNADASSTLPLYAFGFLILTLFGSANAEIWHAMHWQPVQLTVHSDLHIGHMLAYVASPALSNTVAGRNLQYQWPGHYWHALFSLTTATLYARYFGHQTTVASKFVYSKIAHQLPNLAVPLSGIVCTLYMQFHH